MLPITPNGAPTPTVRTEPELKDRTSTPRGVLQKNLKTMVYVGVVLLLVTAMFVSSGKKKGTSNATTKDAAPAPQVQDNTANNVEALRTQLATEHKRQQQEASLAAASGSNGTLAPQAPAASYGAAGQSVAPVPCVPGQVCDTPAAYAPGGLPQAGGNGGQAQVSPEQQQMQQLAAKERERQYATRFESNLVFSRSVQQEQAAPGQGSAAQASPYMTSTQSNQRSGQATSLTAPRAAGEQPATFPVTAGTAPSYKRAAEVNVSAASGQPYVIFEGLSLDTVLMNRLDGDAAGPVKVLVSDPVYSHDHQHVLIPEGTIVFGEARKLGGAGFGQQRRMAVVFH